MSIFKKVLQNNESKKSTAFEDVLFSDKNKVVLKGEKPFSDTKTTMSKVVSQEEPVINYRLYKNEIFNSINLEEEYFTNFLPSFEVLDGYIEVGLDKLKNKPGLLSHTEKRNNADSVRVSGEFKDRIESIVLHYDVLNSDDGKLVEALHDGFIRKSKIETPLGDSGALRLISLYSKDITSDKTYFDLLFIDFYHLFIPSPYKGVPAKIHAKSVYNKRKKCNETVHKHLKSNLFNT